MAQCNKPTTVTDDEHAYMISALGIDVTRQVYKINNGYALNKTKNGEHSKVFDFIRGTNLVNGDTKKAFRYMSIIVSPKFKKQFPKLHVNKQGQISVNNKTFKQAFGTILQANEPIETYYETNEVKEEQREQLLETYYKDRKKRIYTATKPTSYKDFIKQIIIRNNVAIDKMITDYIKSVSHFVNKEELHKLGYVKTKEFIKTIIINNIDKQINNYNKLINKYVNNDKAVTKLKELIANYEELKENMLRDNSLLNEAIKELSAELNYSFDNNEYEDETILNEDEDNIALAKLFDKFNTFNSINNDINIKVKEILNSLPKYKVNIDNNGKRTYTIKKNAHLGFNESVDINTSINYLKKALFAVTKTDVLLDKIKELSKVHKEFEKLYEILEQDLKENNGELVNLFIHNFNRHKRTITQRLVINGKSVLTTANSIPKYALTNNLINSFIVKFNNNYFTKDKINKLNELYSLLKFGKDTKLNNKIVKVSLNNKERAQVLTELLNDELGIPITFDLLLNIQEKENIDDIYNIQSFINTIKILTDYNVEDYKKNSVLKTSPKELFESKIVSKIIRLSQLITDNTLIGTDDTLINSEGTKEYIYDRDNFISLFFDKIHNSTEEELREFVITELYPDKSLHYSNWIGDGKATTVDSMILKLKQLDQRQFGGSKELGTVGYKYENSTDMNFILDLFIHYSKNIKKLGDTDNECMTPSIILSDSPKLVMYKHKRFKINLGTDYKIFTENDTKIIKLSKGKTGAINVFKNAIATELQRMNDAKELMLIETTNDKGIIKYKVNENIDINNLEQGHHLNGDNILDDNDVVTGNVFRFSVFPALNDIDGIFDEQGLPIISIDDLFEYGISNKQELSNSEELINTIIKQIEQTIDNNITNEVKELYNNLKDKSLYLINQLSDTAIHNKKDADKLLFKFITDFIYNTKLSYIEQQNLFNGTMSEHIGKTYNAQSAATNKRGKFIVSPFEILGTEGVSKTAKAIILKDIVQDESKNLTDILKTIIKDKDKLNEITKHYKHTNIADGQGYITEHGLALYLHSTGEFSKYANLFIKQDNGRYRLKDDIDFNEIQALTVIKPFYYNREFDKTLNTRMSTGIKTSFVLLSHHLTDGTDLEKLVEHMDNNNIEIAVYESAVKVGIRNVIDMYDNKGNLKLKDNGQLDINKNHYIELKRERIGNQVKQVNHHKDTQIKASIQLFKIITANAKTDEDIVLEQEYNTLYSDLIKASGIKLSKELQDKLSDKDLRLLLLDLAKRNITQDEIKQLELDEHGNFKIPLDFSNGTRWQALLNSLYTKRVTGIKHSGLHNVLVSGSMIYNNSNTNIKVQDNYKGNKLKHYIDDNELDVFEVAVTPFSKDFYNENGTLKDISEIDDEVLTLLSYRIPLATKSKAFIIKVKEFITEEIGSTIIVPNEIIERTGTDFDVDSLFMFKKKHYVDDNGKVKELNYADISDDDTINDEYFDKRFNRILDIFKHFIASENHRIESSTPSIFKEAYDISTEINNKLQQEVLNNPTSINTQLKYKSAGLIAKKLIGIFANNNASLVVLQRIKAFHNMNIPISYTKSYLKNNGITIKSLKEKFGANNVKQNKHNTNIIDVYNTNIFFNEDGSFDNVNGQLYNVQYAQWVDYVVDAVKNPLPHNLSLYTIDILTPIMLHGDMNYAINLLEQEALTIINDKINNSIFTTTNTDKWAIHNAKSTIIKKMMNEVLEYNKTKNDNDLERDTTKTTTNYDLIDLISRLLKNKSNIYRLNSEYNFKNKTVIEPILNLIKPIAITTEQLEKDIDNKVKYNNLPIDDKLNYLGRQLQYLNKIEEYKKLGKVLTNYILKLSFDKTGTGKSVNENSEKLNELYDTLDKELLNFEKGNLDNLLLSKLTNKPILNSIYTKDNSIYPQLQNYLKYSNESALDYTNNIFKLTIQNPLIYDVYSNVLSNLAVYDKINKEKVSKFIIKYIKYQLLANHSKQISSFTISKEKVLSILGKDNKINLDKNITFENFKDLSLANKIEILKDKLDLTKPDYKILNYLKGMLGKNSINNNNGFHKIEVTDVLSDTDLLTDVRKSFLLMLNNEDKFVQETIYDMVIYNLHTNGLSIAGNSFSYMIDSFIFSPNEDFAQNYQLNRLNNLTAETLINDISLLMVNTAPKIKLQTIEENDSIVINKRTSFGFHKDIIMYNEDNKDEYNALPTNIKQAKYINVYNPLLHKTIVYEHIYDYNTETHTYKSTNIRYNKDNLLVEYSYNVSSPVTEEDNQGTNNSSANYTTDNIPTDYSNIDENTYEDIKEQFEKVKNNNLNKPNNNQLNMFFGDSNNDKAILNDINKTIIKNSLFGNDNKC